LFDLGHLFLQFLSQHWPIDFEPVHDTVTFLIIRQAEPCNPKFFLDIRLKVLDIVEILLISMDDNEILQRDLAPLEKGGMRDIP